MDSLAVATAVIQFIEFTSGLINKGIAIHSSATGLTVDHKELKTITASISQSSDEIQQSLANKRGRRMTGNERDLEKIATGCQAVANELLQVLAGLASKGPRTKWRSFRQALRVTWNEGKVKALEDRLDRFRQQMMVNILNSLRKEADNSVRQLSSMRESVERIETLQRDSIPVGDRFVRQIMDGEQWRRDLIEMIHKQGQTELQRMANVSHLKDDKGATPTAVIVHEKQTRQRIMHKLAFRNMAGRERRISKAHQRTFEWIFCDPKSDTRPWSSFKDFLERPDKRIYWITGKPGSGKSTLMKYIRHHPQTTNFLQAWSGNDEIVRAAFYFWNSGSRMQMSVDGLLQTLLHDCLAQLPHVVQEVLPERWEAATLFLEDDFPWTWEEVTLTLRRLVTTVCPEKKFLFMIDGLDECSGNHAQLVDLISELAEDAENLKLCVASRPWNNFEEAFRGRPSLMLQDVTAADIECYITSKFTANGGFAELQERSPRWATTLLDTISRKAEGVFLWVHLVVQSLLEGLTNGDGLRDLHKRLKELPPNLEDLCANILKNLDDRYLEHASQLFQIVRASDEPPTLWRLALADLEGDDSAVQAPVEPMSERKKSALCKNMKRKLASRCRGLLDISSLATQFGDDDDLDWILVGEADDKVREASMADMEIQYLHRSVRDYIQSPEVWSLLILANKEPFDPHLRLLKSHLLELKSLSPASLAVRDMGFHIWMAIRYANRSLDIPTKTKNGQVNEAVLLLDELDKASVLLTNAVMGRDSTFVDCSGSLQGGHWSSFFLIHVMNPSFLHMMAVCGVHQYLEVRLRSWELEDNGESNKTSLLVAALQGSPIVPEMRGYEDLFGPHREVLEALLRKGWDCHKGYDGRCAWDLARKAGYTDVLELFEKYRGKPPPKPSLDNSKSNSSNDKDSPNFRRTTSQQDQDESDNESNTSTEVLCGD